MHCTHDARRRRRHRDAPPRTLFTAPSDAERRAALATLAAARPGWCGSRCRAATGRVARQRAIAHVRDGAHRPARASSRPGWFAGPFVDELPPGVAAGLFRHMLNANPPDHGRLRRLVAAAFTRRRAGGHGARGSSSSPTALLDRAVRGAPGRWTSIDGARRASAGAGHRRSARRARGRLPPVPRLDAPAGHRRAGRTRRLRRRRGRHARSACASSSPDAAQRTRRRPAVRARRRAGGGRPARRGRADFGRVPAARRRPRDHRQPHRERRARAAHAPRPARPAAGRGRTCCRPPSRRCCATTGRST